MLLYPVLLKTMFWESRTVTLLFILLPYMEEEFTPLWSLIRAEFGCEEWRVGLTRSIWCLAWEFI